MKLRQATELTPTTKLVGHASIFASADSRTGRCEAYRAKLAHEAGCSVRSVSRASHDLAAAGLVDIVPTYGPRRRAQDGRWFRPRGPNVWLWRAVKVLPPILRAKPAADSSILIKERELPAPLAAALARLGNSMADRRDREAGRLEGLAG